MSMLSLLGYYQSSAPGTGILAPTGSQIYGARLKVDWKIGGTSKSARHDQSDAKPRYEFSYQTLGEDARAGTRPLSEDVGRGCGSAMAVRGRTSHPGEDNRDKSELRKQQGLSRICRDSRRVG